METNSLTAARRPFTPLLRALLIGSLSLAGIRSASALDFVITNDASMSNTGIISASDAVAARAAVDYVAAVLKGLYNDPITIRITLATAALAPGVLGQSSGASYYNLSYGTVRSALTSHSSSVDDAAAVASLPATAPTGASTVRVSTALARALGLGSDDGSSDGTYTFNSGFPYTFDPNNRAVASKVDFIGVAYHEITELMGRVGNKAPPDPYLIDLFRYSGPGTRVLSQANGVYFSIDGGNTLLKQFNAVTAGDTQDWASGANDAFNAATGSGVKDDLTAVDLRAMDVIGYHPKIVAGGEFDDPVATGTQYGAVGSPPVTSTQPWTFTSGGVAVDTNGVGYGVTGSSNGQYAYLQGNNASMSQAVYLPAAGTYALFYNVAGRDPASAGGGNTTFSVSLSGLFSDTGSTTEGNPFFSARANWSGVVTTPGIYTLTFTNTTPAANGDQTCLFDSIVITRLPVATASSYFAFEDTANSMTFTGTDPDGDLVTSATPSQALHGHMTNLSGLTATYVPDWNYTGSDTISHYVEDSNGAYSANVAQSPVTVFAVNDTPSFALPTGAITGAAGATWVAQGGGVSRSWRAITSSASGNTLVAAENGGALNTTTNSGVHWSSRDSHRSWTCLASSDDGTKLAAGVSSGKIYTSTDSGANWAPQGTTSRSYTGIASSADGTMLVACVNGGVLYTSTDSGVNWTARLTTTNRSWTGVASSSNGQNLVAVATSQQIYTSTDAGQNWTPHDSSRSWTCVASSSDGTSLVAGVSTGFLYTSTNSGATWTQRGTSKSWQAVASSADGTKLIAAPNGAQLYLSTDSGVNWAATESSRSWKGVATSADGTKLAAVVSSGDLYTSVAPSATYALTVSRASGANTITNFAPPSRGPADESGQSLLFQTSNDNSGMFNSPPFIDTAGTLYFTPKPTVSGTATVTIQLQDSGGTSYGGADTSATQIFTITTLAPPTVTTGSASNPTTAGATLGGTVNANGSSTVVTFKYGTTTAYGGTAPAAESPVSGSTSTPVSAAVSALQPHTLYHFLVTGTSAGGPVNGLDATFTTANTPPTATPQSGLTTNEDTAKVITLAGTDANGDALTFAVATQPAHGGVSLAGSTATYTPAADYFGADSFTFTASDAYGGTSTPATVSLTVTAVNDPPTLATITNPAAINEDAGVQTVNLSGIGAGAANETDTLTVTASSSNPALIPNPTVTYTSPSATGSLSYTPVANANGSAIITVTVDDGQATNHTVTRTFTVAVNSVNDAPSFVLSSNAVSVTSNAGAQSTAAFVTGISPGPANEAAQTVSFNVLNNNNALFTTQPAIAANGTLTFTPQPSGTTSTATVTVTAQDNGGTANGGVDTSAAQTFTITTTDSVPPTLTAVTMASNNANAAQAKAGDTITLSFTSSEALQTPTGSLAGRAATVSGSGANWTAAITVTGTDPQGATSLSIVFKDTAGNNGTTVSAVTSGAAVNIDRTAPATPAASALAAASDSGSSNSDGITKNTTLTFTGTAEAGATVQLFDSAAAGNAATATGGNYSITQTFTAGTHSLTVKATDAAGNTSGASTATSVTVDTTLPVVTPPGNVTAHATSPSGAVLGYTAATATDNVTASPAITYSQATDTIFAPGTTTVTVTATDTAGNAGIATFTVTVTPLTSAESWRYANFGSADNTGAAADNADPDGDGLSNLLEFAFNTNPMSGSSGPPSLGYTGTFAGGGTVSATGQPVAQWETTANGIDYRALFVRRTDYVAAGLTYAVQFSPDLTAWTTSGATPTVLADNGAAQIVSVPYPFGVGGKKARYFRVVVTIAP